MKHIANLQPFLAIRLVEQLKDLGIPAATTELDAGGVRSKDGMVANVFSVWVLDEKDVPQSLEVLEILQYEGDEDMGRCPECGCSLKGLEGPLACPECDTLIHMHEDEAWWTCAECGEKSPSSFETCWRCSRDEESVLSEEPAGEDDQPGFQNKMIKWFLGLFVIILALRFLL